MVSQEVAESAKAGSLDAFVKVAASFKNEDLASWTDKEKRSLLHFAAYSGSAELCRHLIEQIGSQVDPKDTDGDTPLSIACNTGKLAVAEYLVGRGASVHPTSEGSQGPLHYAATCGNDRLLALLADAGASLEAPSRQGSPLCWAAAAGSGPSVRWLLARGASAAVSTSDGVTPVFMAAAAGAEECVEALLSAGSPADAPAHGGITALHVAASLCRPSLVRLLLSRGAASCAQLRDRNGQGDTPLEAAAKSRRGAAAERRETIEALLGVSPPPTGLPAQATAEDVDGWGRERGGGAAEDSGAGGDESAVASRRAVVPVAEDFDLDKAKELKRRGDEAFVSGRMEEAAQSYTESLKHDTQSAVVWANRAMACLKLGRFEDALRDAMVSRTLDADYVKAWFREGKAYHALGRFQEAAEAFYMALSKDKDNEEIMNAFLTAVEEGKKAHQAAQSAAT